jgi:hypothetical protein
MKHMAKVVLLSVGALIPAEAHANDGGWWDWFFKWDPKLMGISSEIHVLCLDENRNRVRGCEEWFRNVPKALSGRDIVHNFQILDPATSALRPVTFRDIKHEFDFRFGYYWNYGDRYDAPDPPSKGAIRALKLAGAYLYRVNDVVAVGGGLGYLPVWGDRFPNTLNRSILSGNVIVYPFPSWRGFAIRPELYWIPGGFTGADFGDPGVSYAKDNIVNFSVAVGVDLRRIGR